MPDKSRYLRFLPPVLRPPLWREAGLLVDRGGNVALTEGGFLVSDALFVDLL